MRFFLLLMVVLGSWGVLSWAELSGGLERCARLAAKKRENTRQKPEVIQAAESLGFHVDWEPLSELLDAVDHYFLNVDESDLISAINRLLPAAEFAKGDRSLLIQQYQTLLSNEGDDFLLFRRNLLGQVLASSGIEGKQAAGLWPQVLLLNGWCADLNASTWLSVPLTRPLYFKEIREGKLVVLGKITNEPRTDRIARKQAAGEKLRSFTANPISIGSVKLLSQQGSIRANAFVFEAEINLPQTP
jgi:hypothetical protein